jgi:TonB family protein
MTRWHPAPGASISFPGSGRTLQLKRGWVRTPRWFSDFVLDVEFRLLEERTVAGILIHAQPLGRDGDRIAYRVNLTNDVNGPDKMGRIEGGQLTFREVSFDQSAATAAMRPFGEWQTLRVQSTNGAARVTANGVPISMSDQFMRRAGHIGIEVSGGAIEVRLAKVERRDTYLDGPEDPVMERGVPAAGTTSPRVRVEIKPEYSVEAMRVLKQGLVTLEAVVLPDGTVGAIRGIKSLDLDLDQAAVAALRRWQFYPAIRNGEPVPNLIVVELSFKLK